MSRVPGSYLKKSYFIVYDLLSFANLDIVNFLSKYIKYITDSSFKHGQLIEDNE